jgi:hypothetical protein
MIQKANVFGNGAVKQKVVIQRVQCPSVTALPLTWTHQQHYLTSWNRTLLEKLIVAQLVNKFPVFYEAWKFIAVGTRARHWMLSWATWIQSTPSHPVSFERGLCYNMILPSTPKSLQVVSSLHVFRLKLYELLIFHPCMLHYPHISSSFICSS